MSGGNLSGSVAVVTGASGGLGAHFVQLLADNGAAVALTARRVDRIQAQADALKKAGVRAIAIRLDVADAASIGPVLDQIQSELGPMNILVNTGLAYWLAKKGSISLR